ncbi:MAG TPA: condensation domain-containing protein, partial [Ktedonobacteraceae bacterium]
GEVLDAQIAYWRKQLYEATALELPVNRSTTALRTAHGALTSFQFSTDLSESLVALSRREGITLFMLLLAAFQTFLYRYTGKEDIVIGTDIANRVRMETEGMIGFFVNLLALRTRFYGNPRFREILQQVREVVLDAYAYQDLPFEQIVDACQLERTANQIPLIRVLFVFQNAPMIPLQMQGLTIQPIEIEMHTTNFDLAVFLREEAGSLSGAVNYSTDLFDAETIATILQQFEVLLHDVVDRTDARVNALEIHTEEKKQQQYLEIARKESKLRQHLKATRRTDIDLSE